MYEYYFTFQSISKAQKAANLLIHEGITAKISKTPRQIASHGCSYSLSLQPHDRQAAGCIFARHNLSYDHLYQVGPGNQIREVRL